MRKPGAITFDLESTLTMSIKIELACNRSGLERANGVDSTAKCGAGSRRRFRRRLCPLGNGTGRLVPEVVPGCVCVCPGGIDHCPCSRTDCRGWNPESGQVFRGRILGTHSVHNADG